MMAVSAGATHSFHKTVATLIDDDGGLTSTFTGGAGGARTRDQRDYESVFSASATRRYGWLKNGISTVARHISSFQYVLGTARVRLQVALGRRGNAGVRSGRAMLATGCDFVRLGSSRTSVRQTAPPCQRLEEVHATREPARLSWSKRGRKERYGRPRFG
jgi:hypothetical protein